MAAQPAREMPQGPIISTEDRTFFVLPKKPTRVDQASYEYYVRGCVEKHLDTPDLVTPEQINPLYYRWLSALHVSAPDQSFALLSQVRKVE